MPTSLISPAGLSALAGPPVILDVRWRLGAPSALGDDRAGLRRAGHPHVLVLKGGFPTWEGPLATGDEPAAQGDFTVVPGGMPVLEAGAA